MGGGYAGYGNGPFSWLQPLPGAQYDYVREAGILWQNSIVLACINRMSDMVAESPIEVVRKGAEDQYKTIDNHPLSLAVAEPNKFYDDTVLWAGTVLSWVVDGNAYWYKLRSGTGQVVGFIYVPHFSISPKSDKNNDAGTELITYYEYRFQGKKIVIPMSEIVHFRAGIDPMNQAKGLSRLGAGLREICTDNEISTFMAAMLRNMGVPGVILSPKDANMQTPTPEQTERIKSLWKSKFTGDSRGEPFVAPFPIDMASPAFNPEQLLIDKMGDRPEERICALIGMPAAVVGMGAGLESTKVGATMLALKAQAWENCILPMQRQFGKQLRMQTREDFDYRDYQQIRFNTTQVNALQDDRDLLWKRVGTAYQQGLIMRSEGKRIIGLDVTPEDDIYATNPSDAVEEEKDPKKPKDAKTK